MAVLPYAVTTAAPSSCDGRERAVRRGIRPLRMDTSLDEWSLTLSGAVRDAVAVAEFIDLPAQTITVDIHYVAKWSKTAGRWTQAAPERSPPGQRYGEPIR